MAVNKVDFGGNTLVDLTNDTVTPETLFSGVTAHNAAGEVITGTYASRAINFQQSNVPDTCAWSTTEVRLSCNFQPTYLAIVFNSASYANNKVVAVWAIGTSAIVYHTKTSSGIARTQVTSNVNNYWYYDAANKQVVVKSPTSSYQWSNYTYRYFIFK